MRRWHQDYKIARRNWRIHRKSHVESNLSQSVGYEPWQRKPGASPFVVKCACDEQVGRFRKKDAWDCGKPHCMICHSDKFPKRDKTHQEVNSERDFKEALKEFYDHSPTQE
jgi:hypothetical protein